MVRRKPKISSFVDFFFNFQWEFSNSSPFIPLLRWEGGRNGIGVPIRSSATRNWFVEIITNLPPKTQTFLRCFQRNRDREVAPTGIAVGSQQSETISRRGWETSPARNIPPSIPLIRGTGAVGNRSSLLQRAVGFRQELLRKSNTSRRVIPVRCTISFVSMSILFFIKQHPTLSPCGVTSDGPLRRRGDTFTKFFHPPSWRLPPAR